MQEQEVSLEAQVSFIYYIIIIIYIIDSNN